MAGASVRQSTVQRIWIRAGQEARQAFWGMLSSRDHGSPAEAEAGGEEEQWPRWGVSQAAQDWGGSRCWGGEAHQSCPLSLPAVGHHHPGHRAVLPRVPEEGLPLWRDGDCGKELGRHSRPQVVLQVRRGRWGGTILWGSSLLTFSTHRNFLSH